jgi:hypothetical protein
LLAVQDLQGDVQTLTVLQGDIQTLKALQGDVQTLKALQGDIQTLKALQGDIQTLKALQGDIQTLKALQGDVQALKALQGDVQTLKALQVEVQAWKGLQGELQTVKDELADQRARIRFPSNGRMFWPGSDPLNGVISYLTGKHGGDLHDRNIVKITSSSLATSWNSSALQGTVDLRGGNRFCLHSRPAQPHEWLCYDFQQLRIDPTHYLIRTWGGLPGSNHLKNWALEGSMDRSAWEELDCRQNNDLLNGPHNVALFSVLRFREVRMVRIRLTDVNHRGNWFLEFEALELFGILKE